MTGKVIGNSIIVLDSYPLPVEGTETRVNALGEGYEFMVQYLESSKLVNRKENIVGWYHSHPGYGCWLSGIDVDTQQLNQRFQDPFIAVVIDPERTISAGKIEIGAFRTYLNDNGNDNNVNNINFNKQRKQTIPLGKSKDYGSHASRYYPLEIVNFKSTFDLKLLTDLWSKYWISALSTTGIPSETNELYTGQRINDLTEKLSQYTNSKKGLNKSIGDFNKYHKKSTIMNMSYGSGLGGLGLGTKKSDNQMTNSDIDHDHDHDLTLNSDLNNYPTKITLPGLKVSRNKRIPKQKMSRNQNKKFHLSMLFNKEESWESQSQSQSQNEIFNSNGQDEYYPNNEMNDRSSKLKMSSLLGLSPENQFGDSKLNKGSSNETKLTPKSELTDLLNAVEESDLGELIRDGNTIGSEEIHGLINWKFREMLFVSD